MPPESATESSPEGSDFQHGLEGAREPGTSGAATCRGVQAANHGRADELLDLSQLMDAMSDHEHDKQLHILQGPLVPKPALDEGHDHEDDEIVDDTLREHRLELSAVREKLKGKSGKQYWRTLEELSEDPHFEELLHREFPRHASEWDDAVDRRDFLKLMGASLALAGMAGCGRPDESPLLPYVQHPDPTLLVEPTFFPTLIPFGADAVGVLAE